jgi:superfamily II DNA/RNA helicase
MRTIKGFKDNSFQILVATDVAATGIHVDDLSLVINYDVPIEKDSYVHRIGRTGRAGHGGVAISLVTSNEIMSLYEIEEHVGVLIEEEELPSEDAVQAGALILEERVKKEKARLEKIRQDKIRQDKIRQEKVYAEKTKQGHKEEPRRENKPETRSENKPEIKRENKPEHRPAPSVVQIPKVIEMPVLEVKTEMKEAPKGFLQKIVSFFKGEK